MLRKLLKLRRSRGDVRAASRGPKALGKRLLEAESPQAHTPIVSLGW